jgi:hypothetical protein
LQTYVLLSLNLGSNTGEHKCLHSLTATACMRFEVMAVTMNSTVFWNVEQINPDNGGSRFFWYAGNKSSPHYMT